MRPYNENEQLSAVEEYARLTDIKEKPLTADYDAGVEPLETLPAKWWNWLIGILTKNESRTTPAIQDIYDEMHNVLLQAGISPSSADSSQLYKAIDYIINVSSNGDRDYIDQQVAETVDFASQDATNKANQAIATASQDATNKANQAKVEANIYTDSAFVYKPSFVVKTQADFDKWVHATTGNDYSAILIYPGTYVTIWGVDLTAAGTCTILGIEGVDGKPKINITQGKGIGYTSRPDSNNYWIKNIELTSYAGFVNCINLTNCIGMHDTYANGHGFQGCSNLSNCTGIGRLSAFDNCTNLTNCTGTSTNYNSTACGFNGCSNLTNCVGTGNSTSYSAYGFNNCSNLTNCVGTGNSTNSTACGFISCINLTNCVGTGSTTGTNAGSYGFVSCNSLTNCMGTGINPNTSGYGFSNCFGVRYCKKANTSTTATFNINNCSANQGYYYSTYAVANTQNGGFNDLT